MKNLRDCRYFLSTKNISRIIDQRIKVVNTCLFNENMNCNMYYGSRGLRKLQVSFY